MSAVESRSAVVEEPCLGAPDRVALAIPVLRGVIAALDQVFTSFAPQPEEGSRPPAGLALVQVHLAACRAAADSAGLALLGRIVARTAGLTERLRSGYTDWGLVAKLALEELVTVFDMVVDVVELVGTDSGCRHEERVSLRIIASVAPQVLVEVDALDFREIRFHQAVLSSNLQRTA